jgi:hypothetical protein
VDNATRGKILACIDNAKYATIVIHVTCYKPDSSTSDDGSREDLTERFQGIPRRISKQS